jgi:hypothetical protein
MASMVFTSDGSAQAPTTNRVRHINMMRVGTLRTL